jgi:hypothetical protein
MRKWINLFEDTHGYAPVLETSWDIASYISEMSPDYVDEEVIAEHFHGCRAVLTRLATHELSEGPADANVPNEEREAEYMQMDGLIPPLVVENKVVVDGNHRLRVALAKGIPELLCYVIEEA